jgi:hypothetical protein
VRYRDRSDSAEVETMFEIRIHDLCGPICVDSENGARLCEQLRLALERGETVCLDFSGVTTLATAFLSPAVGGLYGSFTRDDLDRRLLWKGLDSTGDALLRLVQQHAIRFSAATSAQQEALISATGRAVEAD